MMNVSKPFEVCNYYEYENEYHMVSNIELNIMGVWWFGCQFDRLVQTSNYLFMMFSQRSSEREKDRSQ